MPKRIDKLTKKQEALMPVYAKKWIDIGLRTGPADFDTFEKYVKVCYEKAGLKLPPRIVRVKSPLVGALAASVAEGIWQKKRSAVTCAVDDAVGGAVRGAVDDAVGGAVGGAVDGAVRDAVGGAVRGAVDDAVDGAVDDAVGGAVETAIAIAKKAGVKLSWHYWFGGQFWVGYGYYAWYGVVVVDFLLDACKLKLAKDIVERAEAYRKVCESVNYFWLNSDFVIVCDRPTTINRNAEGRLHSMTGKAIEYPDGWGLHYVHGVKFTEEQFIRAQKAGVRELLGWDDIEQRSALLRDKPLEQMLRDANASVIDRTDECGGYKLWEIDLGLRSKAKAMTYDGWSKGADGKAKPYAKWVRPEAKNCIEEIAALRGLTVEEFRNAIKS